MKQAETQKRGGFPGRQNNKCKDLAMWPHLRYSGNRKGSGLTAPRTAEAGWRPQCWLCLIRPDTRELHGSCQFTQISVQILPHPGQPFLDQSTQNTSHMHARTHTHTHTHCSNHFLSLYPISFPFIVLMNVWYVFAYMFINFSLNRLEALASRVFYAILPFRQLQQYSINTD